MINIISIILAAVVFTTGNFAYPIPCSAPTGWNVTTPPSPTGSHSVVPVISTSVIPTLATASPMGQVLASPIDDRASPSLEPMRNTTTTTTLEKRKHSVKVNCLLMCDQWGETFNKHACASVCPHGRDKKDKVRAKTLVTFRTDELMITMIV
jgi:hypothetical protein